MARKWRRGRTPREPRDKERVGSPGIDASRSTTPGGRAPRARFPRIGAESEKTSLSARFAVAAGPNRPIENCNRNKEAGRRVFYSAPLHLPRHSTGRGKRANGNSAARVELLSRSAREPGHLRTPANRMPKRF